MSSDPGPHFRSGSPPVFIAVLVCIAAGTLATSLLLAFSGDRLSLSAGRVQLVQLLNLLLSCLALVLAVTAARPMWRRRMRQLDEWITVCAWTRRVRWEGRWVSFEEYLARRFHLRCTHGISDEAAEKLRAEAARIAPAAKMPQG